MTQWRAVAYTMLTFLEGGPFEIVWRGLKKEKEIPSLLFHKLVHQLIASHFPDIFFLFTNFYRHRSGQVTGGAWFPLALRNESWLDWPGKTSPDLCSLDSESFESYIFLILTQRQG